MNTTRNTTGRDAERETATATPSPDTLLEHEREVIEALRALQFGTLEVTVHQSRIVQITRSEKVRF